MIVHKEHWTVQKHDTHTSGHIISNITSWKFSESNTQLQESEDCLPFCEQILTTIKAVARGRGVLGVWTPPKNP